MAEHPQPALSPDCRDQNHQKCDGIAWDEEADDFGVCACSHHLKDKREKAHQAVKEFDLNPCSLTARAAINALQAFDNRLNQVNLIDTLPEPLKTALQSPIIVTHLAESGPAPDNIVQNPGFVVGSTTEEGQP